MPQKAAVRYTVFDTVKQLKPGRRYCDCQARIHDLVRNCLGCGRIVCQQEGSGPCFNCFSLVCTREERKILDEKSKASYDLLKKLTSNADFLTDKLTFEFAKHSMDDSKSSANAIEYKNKLLLADKNFAKTKVTDLQSDYYSLEDNVYLTAEERELIIKRKDELRQMANAAKRQVVISLDLQNREVIEEKLADFETVNDPIIQSILNKANAAKTSSEVNDEHDEENEEYSSRLKFMKDFKPCYKKDRSSTVPCSSRKLDSKSPNEALRRKNWCVGLKEPLASLVVNGEISHIPWKKEVKYRGVVLISSLENKQETKLLNMDSVIASEILGIDSKPAIVGRAAIMECLTWEEYMEEYPKGECADIRDGFVLIFGMPEALSVHVVHATLDEWGLVDTKLVEIVRRDLLCDDTSDMDYATLCY